MNKKKLAALEKLYAKIPKVNCKGDCHPSCTLIPVSDIEIKRAKERLHYNPFSPKEKDLEKIRTHGMIPSCRALKDNQCTIYHIRPAICRLYAAAEGLDCPFGCSSEKKMTKQEAHNLIREIEAL